ncbi:MAG: indole-3-glycerol phosphate synthase TrpC [Aestuariivita sp.]|nr:indole-3-glycerol phosphate synthase TrpC [Aestuariivita sp.]
MTESILNHIKAYKLEEIAKAKAQKPWQTVYNEALSTAPVRPFSKALKTASHKGYGLIAEIKRASPSKGLIRSDFDPVKLAAAYEQGGASCLSVLTDSPSFKGSKKHLTKARQACGLPVLQKDFMYDPYQVAEARCLGADCILIILATVSDMQASELEAAAAEFNLECLIEIHNRAEVDRCSERSSTLIGINNRNLNSFETTLDTTFQLAQYVPENKLIVAESGLKNAQDLYSLAHRGIRCFLIGESLMRQSDVAAATTAILDKPLPLEAV